MKLSKEKNIDNFVSIILMTYNVKFRYVELSFQSVSKAKQNYKHLLKEKKCSVKYTVLDTIFSSCIASCSVCIYIFSFH